MGLGKAHSSQGAGEGLVQQRLFQRRQRRLLLLVEAREALGFDGESRPCGLPQRGKGIQPRVARNELPWEIGKRVNPYIVLFWFQSSYPAWPTPGVPCSFFARCKRAFAVFDVPRCRRAAKAFIERVVSRRSRTAIAILSGSFFRCVSNSPSLHPRRHRPARSVR